MSDLTGVEFPIQHLEFFLLILVRIAGIFMTAPVFSQSGVPINVKVFLSGFLSLVLVNVLPVQDINYVTGLDFAIIIVQEAICGLLLGFCANIVTQILIMSGHFIDVEIGFAMVNVFDPTVQSQVSITGSMYTNLIMLIMIVTNTHYIVLKGVLESFKLIPIGGIKFTTVAYNGIIKFAADYFVIGIRIALPFLAAILILNSVLGILARSAPQMNMFVIGMQLKVFTGLAVLMVTVGLLPYIADFIFTEMSEMIRIMLSGMAG